MNALEALDACRRLRVLVIGDVMVDAYYIGAVKRVSPEAPVPVVDIQRRERRLGGAGNVVLNLLALGVHVELATAIGADEAGNGLLQQLREHGVGTGATIQTPGRPTTVKTRILSSGQHLLRVDEETTAPLPESVESELIDAVEGVIQGVDAVLFEDYDKGVLTERIIGHVIRRAQALNLPTTVDPKFRQFHMYRGVGLFKPNVKELQEGLGRFVDAGDAASVASAVDELMERIQPACALVTLSEFGVHVHQPGTGIHHVRQAAHAREIADVSGAGDTVIAVATCLFALGVEATEVARVANLAGGLVCENVGVVPIDATRLRREVSLTPPLTA